MTKFVVTTQVLENYGAHTGSGRFADGENYWKFKGGSDYIVSDVDRPADAMAFVMASRSENGLGYKEFPTAVVTYTEWLENLKKLSKSYSEFLMDDAIEVSPLDGYMASVNI